MLAMRWFLTLSDGKLLSLPSWGGAWAGEISFLILGLFRRLKGGAPTASAQKTEAQFLDREDLLEKQWHHPALFA